MKIYYTHYLGLEGGVITAFSNKRDAQKHQRKLERLERLGEEAEEFTVTMAYELSEIEFPLSKDGLLNAFETGAYLVAK